MKVSRPTTDILQVRTPIESDEIHVREVKGFGNGARIDFIKKFVGKKVLVVVLKDDGL